MGEKIEIQNYVYKYGEPSFISYFTNITPKLRDSESEERGSTEATRRGRKEPPSWSKNKDHQESKTSTQLGIYDLNHLKIQFSYKSSYFMRLTKYHAFLDLKLRDQSCITLDLEENFWRNQETKKKAWTN